GCARPRPVGTASGSGTVAYLPTAVTTSKVRPGASSRHASSNRVASIAPADALAVTSTLAHVTATTSPVKPIAHAKGTAEAKPYQGETPGSAAITDAAAMPSTPTTIEYGKALVVTLLTIAT